MVRWRAGCVLAAIVALVCLYPRPCLAELVSTKVTADEVRFSYDRRYVTLSGNARVFAQVVEDPSRFVTLHADFAEGDLQTGRFELVGNVDIRTADGALSGDSVAYNTATAQYSVRRGGVMLPIENPEGERVWGYAYAREVTSEDKFVYLVDGRFTTCASSDPEYTVEVDRIRYNTETSGITVWGGALRLYGLRIPLVDRFEWKLAQRGTTTPKKKSLLAAFVPAYSGRDGIRLQATRSLPELGWPMDGALTVWLTQRRDIRAELQAIEPIGDLQAHLNVSYQEDTRADLDRVVTIDRLPEVGLTAGWDAGGGERDHLEANVWLGSYTQRADEDLPGDVDVTDQRALVSARYTGNYDAWEEREGAWWWLDGSQAFYQDGDRYGWLAAGVGASADVADWLSLWAEVSHYEVEGTTPFDFDDLDVENELAGHATLRAGGGWSTEYGARYDLDRSELRDYSIELRKRTDCLTWKAEYRDVGNTFQVGLEINGLYGNYEPPESPGPEGGVPPYWQYLEGDVTPAGDAQVGTSDTTGATPEP